MAKNRDRRQEQRKPKEAPKGEPPALRRARPDLMLRLGNAMMQGHDWRDETYDPMKLAKALGEHVEDVEDCLLRMLHDGRLVRHGLLFRNAPSKPPPQPEPKPRVDPDVLLRVRKVFERVSTAKIEDFGQKEGVLEALDHLLARGHIQKLSDGSFAWNRPVVPAQAKGPGLAKAKTYRRSKFEWRGKGRCPWCKGKTRRHARSEVHDPEECRLRMISNIMSS